MGIINEFSPDHAEPWQISWLNVCHRRDDLERHKLGDQTMARNAVPKFDSEAADEKPDLDTQTSSRALFPDLPAAESKSANQSQRSYT
jgi:hypothetical protein